MSWLRVAGAAFTPGMKFLPRLVAKATPAAQGVARTLGSSYGARAGLGAGVGFLTGEGAPGGRLGGAVIGGGLGALPMHNFPGVPWLTTKGAAGLTKLGVAAPLAQNLAQAAIPGALIAGGSNLGGTFSNSPTGQAVQGAGQAIGGGGNFALQGGAGWVAHNRLTGETIPLGPQGVQDALAPGMGQYGPTGAMGTILDQLSPTSPYAGRRLGTKLDSKTNAEALNILMPTIMKWSEETKRRDLARDMQAAGIRQNIATNAALNQIAAQAGADRGTTASSQLGGAITNKYSFG